MTKHKLKQIVVKPRERHQSIQVLLNPNDVSSCKTDSDYCSGDDDDFGQWSTLDINNTNTFEIYNETVEIESCQQNTNNFDNNMNDMNNPDMNNKDVCKEIYETEEKLPGDDTCDENDKNKCNNESVSSIVTSVDDDSPPTPPQQSTPPPLPPINYCLHSIGDVIQCNSDNCIYLNVNRNIPFIINCASRFSQLKMNDTAMAYVKCNKGYDVYVCNGKYWVCYGHIDQIRHQSSIAATSSFMSKQNYYNQNNGNGSGFGDSCSVAGIGSGGGNSDSSISSKSDVHIDIINSNYCAQVIKQFPFLDPYIVSSIVGIFNFNNNTYELSSSLPLCIIEAFNNLACCSDLMVQDQGHLIWFIIQTIINDIYKTPKRIITVTKTGIVHHDEITGNNLQKQQILDMSSSMITGIVQISHGNYRISNGYLQPNQIPPSCWDRIVNKLRIWKYELQLHRNSIYNDSPITEDYRYYNHDWY